MQGSEPPPGYAAYPRGQATYGSADQLRALADGYFGLNRVFLINIVLVLAVRAATASTNDPNTYYGILIGSVVAVGLIVGFMTFPHNKKIGYGANWQPGSPVLASVLMGLNSALCCGIIGYIVVQGLAAKEIKKYGLNAGAFGLKRTEIEQRIAEMRAAESSPLPSPPVM
jgi:hypothetical protein